MPVSTGHGLGRSILTPRSVKHTVKRTGADPTPSSRSVTAVLSRGYTVPIKPALAPIGTNISTNTTRLPPRDYIMEQANRNPISTGQASDRTNRSIIEQKTPSHTALGKHNLDDGDRVSIEDQTGDTVKRSRTTAITKSTQFVLSAALRRPNKGRNAAYSQCKPETQVQRDYHIGNISQSWNMSENRWMNLPHAPVDRSETLRPRHPRDWSNTLLAALDTLAKETRNDFLRARRALDLAFRRQCKGTTGPQSLIPSMVGDATEICKTTQTGNTAGPSRQGDAQSDTRLPIDTQGAQAMLSTAQQTRTSAASRSSTLQPQQQQPPRSDFAIDIECNLFASSQLDASASRSPQDMKLILDLQKAKTERLQREIDLSKSREKELVVIMAQHRQAQRNSAQDAIAVA